MSPAEVSQALFLLELQASNATRETLKTSEACAMILGHEVVARVTIPSQGITRTYWRLNGDRKAGARVRQFLRSEAREVV